MSKKAFENCSPSLKVLSMNLKLLIFDKKFALLWNGLGTKVGAAGASSDESLLAVMIACYSDFAFGYESLLDGMIRWAAS